MARVDRENARAQADAGRSVRVRRQNLKSVAPEAVGDPEDLVVRRVGSTGEVHSRGEIGARGKEYRGARHGAQSRGVTPRPSSWARRSSPLSLLKSRACIPTCRAASTLVS